MPDSSAQLWLDTVKVPEFTIPADMEEWTARKAEIRATLWRLLGEFPPRPRVPEVTVLSRTDEGDYILEKFAYSNGLNATVPGYLFLPKSAPGKVPAILYCHWHAGQYEVGKEEMLRQNATPVPPGPALARLGFAVLGIDACPMEGIEPAKYDDILGLDALGLSTVVVATAGFRAATDKHATLKKVRFVKNDVIVTL